MGKPDRLSKKLLQEDIAAYAALQAITDYKPSNTDFELADVSASHQLMGAKQTEEIQKQAIADAARDAAEMSERAFHNMMLSAKNQVRAQFGDSSDQYASLGMKKKTAYRRGRPGTAKNSNQPT